MTASELHNCQNVIRLVQGILSHSSPTDEGFIILLKILNLYRDFLQNNFERQHARGLVQLESNTNPAAVFEKLYFILAPEVSNRPHQSELFFLKNFDITWGGLYQPSDIFGYIRNHLDHNHVGSWELTQVKLFSITSYRKIDDSNTQVLLTSFVHMENTQTTIPVTNQLLLALDGTGIQSIGIKILEKEYPGSFDGGERSENHQAIQYSKISLEELTELFSECSLRAPSSDELQVTRRRRTINETKKAEPGCFPFKSCRSKHISKSRNGRSSSKTRKMHTEMYPASPDRVVGDHNVQLSSMRGIRYSTRFDIQSACKLYETNLNTVFNNNVHFISNPLYVTCHEQAYNDVLAKNLIVNQGTLLFHLKPIFQHFTKKVLKHNEKVADRKIGISQFKGMGHIVLDIFLSQLNNSYQSGSLFAMFIMQVNRIVQQNQVYTGGADPNSWVLKIFSKHKPFCDELEAHLFESCLTCGKGVALFYSMDFDGLTQHISNTIDHVRVSVNYTKDTKFQCKVLEGQKNIIQFCQIVYSFSAKVQDLINKLLTVFAYCYKSAMTKLLEFRLFRTTELGKLSESVILDLLKKLDHCILCLFEERYKSFFLESMYTPKNDLTNLVRITGIQRKQAQLSLRVITRDELKVVSNLNKTNIKQLYESSVGLTKKQAAIFQATVTTKCVSLEECNQEKKLIEQGLLEAFGKFRFPIDSSDFVGDFRAQCDLLSKTVLCNVDSSRELKPSLGLVEPALVIKQAKVQSLLIDLNFNIITVANTEDIEDGESNFFRFLPEWRITPSKVCVGESSTLIDTETGGEVSLKFSLFELLNRDSVRKTHACYDNGKLRKDIRCDIILSYFLTRIKIYVEGRYGIKWESVLIVLPLRFTTGQRWVVKQAAQMAGFVHCKLVNNTSVVAFGALPDLKITASQKLYVAVKSDGVFDVALYMQNPKTNQSDFDQINMLHSVCNIPENLSTKWLNSNYSPKYPMDCFIVDNFIKPCLRLKSRDPIFREVFLFVIPNERINRPERLHEDKNTSSVIIGATRLLSSAKAYGKPLSYFIKETIPYPLCFVSPRKGFCCFDINSRFDERRSIRLSGQCTDIMSIIEYCDNEDHVLCCFRVNSVKSNTDLHIRLDDDGCLKKPRQYLNTDENQSQKPEKFEFKWVKAKFPKKDLQEYLNRLQKESERVEILAVIDNMKNFIGNVEPEIRKIANVVKKKFVTDALISLKMEIANDACTTLSIKTQESKLIEFLKKFGIEIDTNI